MLSRFLSSFAASFVARLKEQSRPTTAWVFRITISTVAAYMAAKVMHPTTDGVTGALTALLVVQVTLHNTLRHGFDRILSVVLGVGVASLLSEVTGITWWSLGLAVAVSVLAGQMLRVGPNLPEVAISAMLVLSANSSGNTIAAGDRLLETLVGAIVGVLVNVLFPPGERSQSAGAAIEGYANEIASLLEKAAKQLMEQVTPEQASSWLASARQLDARIGDVDRVVTHADESRLLNVRAIAKRDPGQALRAGLDNLEHCTVSMRSVFRGIHDVMHYPDSDEHRDDPYPFEAREVTSAVLDDFARAMRVFGRLIHAQVYGAGLAEEEEMKVAITALSDARRQVNEFVRTHPGESQIVQELNMVLVATIGRVLRELNVEGNGWLARKSHYDDVARHRGVIAADKLRDRSRQLMTRRSQREASRYSA